MAERGAVLGNMIIQMDLDNMDFIKSLSSAQRATKQAMKEMQASLGIVKRYGSNIDKLEQQEKSLGRVLKTMSSEQEQLNKKYQEAVKTSGANSQQAQRYATKINDLTAKQAKYGNLLDDTKRKLVTARNSTEELTKSLDQQRKSTELEAGKLRVMGKENKALRVEQKGLSKELDLTTRILNKERSSLSQTTRAYGVNSNAVNQQKMRVKELELAQAKLQNRQKMLNSSLGRMKTNILGFNKSINGMHLGLASLGFGIVMRGSIQFNDQIQSMAALLDNGKISAAALKNQLSGLSKASMKWSSDYGISTEQINEGMSEIIKKGYTYNQTLGAMPSILDAAKASGDDFNTVMSNSTSILEQFDLKVASTSGTLKNTKRVTDTLTFVANETAAGFSDMGTAMEYVGPVAHGLNISLEQTAAAIGLLSNNGLEGEKAGTALRGMLSRLMKPSKKNVEAFDAMGISFRDFQKGALTLPDLLEKIKNNTQDMTKAERTALIAQGFGTEAQTGVNILVNQGADALRKLTKETKQASGYTNKLAKTMNNTAAANVHKFVESIKNLGVILGNTILPMINPVVTRITAFIQKLSEMPNVMKMVVGGIGTLIGTLLLLKGTVGVFNIATTIGAMFTNPVGIAVLAIEGAVLAIIGLTIGIKKLKDNWSSIGKWLSGVWIKTLGLVGISTDKARQSLLVIGNVVNKTGAFFVHTGQVIKTEFLDVMEATSERMKSIGGLISSSVVGAFGSISGKLSGIMQIIYNNTVGKVTNLFTGLLQAIKGNTDKLSEAILNLLPTVIGFFLGGIPRLIVLGSSIVKAIAEGLGMSSGELITKVTDTIVQTINNLSNALPKFIQIGTDMITSLIIGFSENIGKFADAFSKTVTEIADSIDKNLPSLMENVTSGITSIITSLLNSLPNVINNLSSVVTGLLNSFVTIITANLPMILEAIMGIVTQLVNAFTNLLPTIVTIGMKLVLTLLTTLINVAIGNIEMIVKLGTIILTTLVTSILKLLPSLVGVAVQLISTLIQGLVSALPALINGAIKIIMALVNALIQNLPIIIEAGLKIIMALINGIVQALPAIINAILTLITSLLNVIIQSLPLFIEMAFKIIMALVVGIIKNLPKIIWAILKLVGMIVITLIKSIPKLLKMGVQLIWAIIKGIISMDIALIKAVGKLLTNMRKAAVEKMILVKKGIIDKWNDIKESTKDRIGDMVKSVKEMPGRMLKAVKSGAGKLKQGFVDMWNGVLRGVSGVVNKLTSGINTVLDALGVAKKFQIPTANWGGKVGKEEKKKYKNGTGFHPGGQMIVNDAPTATHQEAVIYPNGRAIIPKGRNVQMFAPQGTQVIPAELTKNLFPHYKKGIMSKSFEKIKDFGSSVWSGTKAAASKVKDIATNAFDYALHPSKIVDKFVSFSGLGGLPLEIAKGSINKIKGYLKGFFSKHEADGGAEPPGSGVKRWASTVSRALAMNGLPTSSDYVNAWLRQIQSESGGNPKAVQGNIGDINNKTGDLAKGLVQVIGATFNAYKFPGHGNRLNGLDSLLAGIAYAKSRYGASGMLGVIGHGHGYANGGIVRNHQIAQIAEKNRPEAVIPLHPSKRSRAYELMSQVNRIIGVKKISSSVGNTNNGLGELLAATLEQNKLLRQLVAKDTNVYLDPDKMERKTSNMQGVRWSRDNYSDGGAPA